MQIETINHGMVDGNKPCETSQTIEDASQLTLLTRHTSQLTVCAVEDVCQAEHENSDDVEHQTLHAIVIETGATKEDGTSSSDKHGKDGYRIGMYIQACEKQCPVIAKGSHKVQV